MSFEFKRSRTDKIPKEEITKELRRVAALFNYRKFGWREFDEVSILCKSYCVKRNFGSWNNALKSIGIPLKEKTKRRFSNNDLFAEMERIWKSVGHRPSRIEWETSDAQISYNTYKKYFGTWTNACLKFIENKTGKSVELAIDEKSTSNTLRQTKSKAVKREKRDVPLRLRLKVLKRDGYKCTLCGRSPAFDKGVTLHVDHILPISKGGKTSLENLQTLCQECNLGKSDEAN